MSPWSPSAAAFFALTTVLLTAALVSTRADLASTRADLASTRTDLASTRTDLASTPKLQASSRKNSCGTELADSRKMLRKYAREEVAMNTWGVPRKPTRRGIYPACTKVSQPMSNTTIQTQWMSVPGAKSKIPQPACARYGRDVVQRPSVCGLNNVPPILPNALTETAAGVRLLGDRFRALKLTVKPGGNYVEIGTLSGLLRNWMLVNLKPAKLTVMDIEKKSIHQCKQRHASEVAAGTVECILGDSKRSLLALPDDSQDLIYIDGDHDYTGVCGDLEAARTKVKPGGVMVLNDYYVFETIFLGVDPALPRGGRWGTYGVIHAANEFILRYKWELVYMTLHQRNEPDLAIRRPVGS